MIDIQVRIHDRFSVEFKIGYMVRKDSKINDFMTNTWIFVPNELDINSFSYTKNQFYRDVKSNVRLITPIYTLKGVADELSLPFMFLEGAFNELVVEPTKENLTDYEYQIKMFISIVRSAMRREVNSVVKNRENANRVDLVKTYVGRIEKIISKYRGLKEILHDSAVEAQAMIYFNFGDEFLTNQIEFQTYRFLQLIREKCAADFEEIQPLLMGLIQREITYKEAVGFQMMKKDSPDKNRGMIFRTHLLRKYAESYLILNANKKKDGRMAEQVYYSIAAGLSMIFATTIAFSFQQKYGNFTIPLFVALVVSYMLKDRIKELTRYYFVHRLAKKYFDNKTTISIKETPVGWMKEGVDFITEDRVPDEVMDMRDRSDLLEADNRNTEERIILYRKLVRIDGEALDENNQYDIAGINDILRFNMSNFIQKMDSPEVPLAVPTADGGYEVVYGEKSYYINFLLQFQYDGQLRYKRFRLVMSRNGIEGIEKL